MKRLVMMMIAVAMVLSMASVAFATEADAATKNINLSKAKSIALKSAKLKSTNVKFIKAKLDREDRVYDVEFIRKSNRAKYDFEISMKGKIYEKSTDYKYKRNYSNKKIGKVNAQKKVARFSKISYSVVKRGVCKYDRDDGQGIYEVKFKKGNYRYDYDVLAATGTVIGYDREMIRR